jgi:hypothetical protein
MDPMLRVKMVQKAQREKENADNNKEGLLETAEDFAATPSVPDSSDAVREGQSVRNRFWTTGTEFRTFEINERRGEEGTWDKNCEVARVLIFYVSHTVLILGTPEAISRILDALDEGKLKEVRIDGASVLSITMAEVTPPGAGGAGPGTAPTFPGVAEQVVDDQASSEEEAETAYTQSV